MRAIASAAGTALQGDVVPIVLLVEMHLSETVYMASASRPIEFGGNTYLGLGDLGTVEAVDDSPGEYKPLRFNLSGVSTDLLAISLEENIRGRACSLRMAVLDPVTHAVLDAPLVWSGTLDQMPVSLPRDQSSSFAIGATAEHRGVTYARPKPLRYTDADQRRLYPTDTSLRFIDAQSGHADVWPAAAYFRV